jgi:hypothetical protein
MNQTGNRRLGDTKWPYAFFLLVAAKPNRVFITVTSASATTIYVACRTVQSSKEGIANGGCAAGGQNMTTFGYGEIKQMMVEDVSYSPLCARL